MSDATTTHDDIFQHVEHIGIAVENIETAGVTYASLMGVELDKIEEVPSEGVRTAFYRVGETKIELLEPIDPEGPIAKFIQKRGPGVHHIAFEVADIVKAMERLKRAGFVLTREIPTKGADNKLVCFVHPKSTGGTLIELCQELQHDHASPE